MPSIMGRGKLFSLQLLYVAMPGIFCCCLACASNVNPGSASTPTVPVYTYQVINTFPHDRKAYTQGLVFEDGILYEGTGGYGSSAITKVEMESGRLLKEYRLPARYFGEGITLLKDTLIQLTWRSNIGFVYDRDSFNLLRDFSYPTEGWGITHDQARIIMSDGTANLYFLNPENFETTGYLEVHDTSGPVNRINELEYINGKIFANVWGTDNIVIIDPGDGSVTGWIDMSGLLDQSYYTSVDILNGIAYDAARARIIVTGKLWPLLFEIVPLKR